VRDTLTTIRAGTCSATPRNCGVTSSRGEIALPDRVCCKRCLRIASNRMRGVPGDVHAEAEGRRDVRQQVPAEALRLRHRRASRGRTKALADESRDPRNFFLARPADGAKLRFAFQGIRTFPEVRARVVAASKSLPLEGGISGPLSPLVCVMSNDIPSPGAGLHHRIAANITVSARQDIAERVATILTAAKRRRRPTLASAKAEAAKAGLTISAATIQADSLRVEFGKPDNVEPLDEWLAKKHARQP
jgi:hypothetical protein